MRVFGHAQNWAKWLGMYSAVDHAMSKLRILVVDDHPVVRQGLRALLSMEENMELVGEAGDAAAGVLLAKEKLPEVAIVDLSMPLLRDDDAIRQIHQTAPSVKILVLSSYGDEEFVRRLQRSGAAGYITKDTAGADLLKAIREVCEGKRFVTHATNYS